MKCFFEKEGIDIKKLSCILSEYLKATEGFNVDIIEKDNATTLKAKKIYRKKRVIRLNIEIIKKSNGIVVNFENPYEKTQLIYTSPFWQFFGGGFLIKERLEDFEYYQSLEQKFWRKITEIIQNFGTESSTHS